MAVHGILASLRILRFSLPDATVLAVLTEAAAQSSERVLAAAAAEDDDDDVPTIETPRGALFASSGCGVRFARRIRFEH